MKKCGTCKVVKALDSFYNRAKGSKDGKWSRCKPCDSIARVKWATDNPERHKYSLRNRALKKKYGITIEDYDKMKEDQQGCCAICNSDETNTAYNTNTFCVDHDHKTGEVRGLLCDSCNRGLGFLQDDPDILLNAVDYLRKKG